MLMYFQLIFKILHPMEHTNNNFYFYFKNLDPQQNWAIYIKLMITETGRKSQIIGYEVGDKGQTALKQN